ncbi:MAG TPA: phosphotransferase [Bradyrhizobium sp.]|nr:phosphotransferase [Bradyrhizobium sp.]
MLSSALIDDAHPIQDLRAASSITEQQAEQLAAEHYGLRPIARRLSSERDQNFLLQANGRGFVLKIANPAEDRAVTRLQTDALLHLSATEPDLPIPRVFPALSGAHELALGFADGSTRVVRLLSYLTGTPMSAIAVSAALRSDIGRNAGRLARGLGGLNHGGVKQRLLWDLQHAAELRPLRDAVPADLSDLVGRFLDGFETHAKPALQQLPRQLVHNDLNPHNIVVDPDRNDRVAGIIDFGDLAFTARVNDLAIAAAYQVGDSDDPLAPACELIAAYHAAAPLDAAELDVLFDLMATRMVMTIVISSWRALRHPENREYILRNHKGAAARLRRIAGLSRHAAQRQIRRACHLE